MDKLTLPKMNTPINYNAIARQYAQNRRVQPEVLRALLSTSGVNAASKVLEVGCGTGNYIHIFAARVGCMCWGLDPSAGMLAKAGAQGGNINFQMGQAENLGFWDDYFDLLYAVDVIHHVRQQPNYFQEAYRVLKPGGKICTVTDSEWIIRHRQPLAAYFPETIEAELKRYPKIAQLRTLMNRAGFGNITEEPVEYPYELTGIQAYANKAYSALHVISEAAYQSGLEQMRLDLQRGPIPCVSRYVLLWGVK